MLSLWGELISNPSVSSAGVFINANNVNISGCTIQSFSSVGILSNVSFNGARITGNAIISNGNSGIYFQVPANGNISKLIIADNKVLNGGVNQGILLDGLTNSNAVLAEVLLARNIVANNGSGSNVGGGIWAMGLNSGMITDNVAFNNNGDNLEFVGGENISLTNNISTNATGPSSDPVAIGIAVTGAVGVTVSGNLVASNSGPGILISPGQTGVSPTNITVVGNTALNNSQHVAGDWAGIQVDTVGEAGTPNYVTVVGNTSSDNQGSPTQGWGVKVNYSTNVLVKGNTFANNKTAGFVAGGTTTGLVVEGNVGYNPVGVSGPMTVGTSPATVTNGATPATYYFLQGATNTATVAEGGCILGHYQVPHFP